YLFIVSLYSWISSYLYYFGYNTIHWLSNYRLEVCFTTSGIRIFHEYYSVYRTMDCVYSGTADWVFPRSNVSNLGITHYIDSPTDRFKLNYTKYYGATPYCSSAHNHHDLTCSRKFGWILRYFTCRARVCSW